MKEVVLKYRVTREEVKTVILSDEDYEKISGDNCDLSDLEQLEKNYMPENYVEESIRVYVDWELIRCY